MRKFSLLVLLFFWISGLAQLKVDTVLYGAQLKFEKRGLFKSKDAVRFYIMDRKPIKGENLPMLEYFPYAYYPRYLFNRKFTFNDENEAPFKQRIEKLKKYADQNAQTVFEFTINKAGKISEIKPYLQIYGLVVPYDTVKEPRK